MISQISTSMDKEDDNRQVIIKDNLHANKEKTRVKTEVTGMCKGNNN